MSSKARAPASGLKSITPSLQSRKPTSVMAVFKNTLTRATAISAADGASGRSATLREPYRPASHDPSAITSMNDEQILDEEDEKGLRPGSGLQPFNDPFRHGPRILSLIVRKIQ